jgi:hypothetical protein
MNRLARVAASVVEGALTFCDKSTSGQSEATLSSYDRRSTWRTQCQTSPPYSTPAMA